VLVVVVLVVLAPLLPTQGMVRVVVLVGLLAFSLSLLQSCPTQ
jgi:hypothetical protein